MNINFVIVLNKKILQRCHAFVRRKKDGTWACFVFAATVDEGGHAGDIKIPEFHGNSYLEIPLRRRVGNTLEFQIWLLVKQPDGRSAVCFYSNFVSLKIMIITFRVSRRRRECRLYWSRASVFVCDCVCVSVRRRMPTRIGSTEIARHETTAESKMQGWKLRETETTAQCCKGWKMRHRPLWTAKRTLNTTLVNFGVVVGSLHVDELRKKTNKNLKTYGGGIAA